MRSVDDMAANNRTQNLYLAAAQANADLSPSTSASHSRIPKAAVDEPACSASKKSNTKQNRIFETWEHMTDQYLKQPILHAVTALALVSARYPRRTITGTVAVSLGLAVAGFFTNFRMVTSGQELWAPVGTRTLRHAEWIQRDAGFDPQHDNNQGYVALLVHQDGSNVLTVQGATCLMEALSVVRSVPGYHETCEESWNDPECPIVSASPLLENMELFHQNHTSNSTGTDTVTAFHLQDWSDEMVQQAVSATTYPQNGAPVVRDVILGHSNSNTTSSNNTNDTLTFAASYLGLIPKSKTDDHSLEWNAVQALYELQERWKLQGLDCRVEANSHRALDDESQRGVAKDIPFMGLAFVMMGLVCALYLSNVQNLIQSRTLLGVGAVVTILLSVLTSYGFLFLVGVPFTPVAQTFLYVMVGIGLDDTFIITGAFFRTNPQGTIVERVEECMKEVGISIVVSTLTTVVAFSLGCATSMPMIRWFCIYAAPCVAVDFLYQITFFVALIVLDEERIRSKRYDCLVCIKSQKEVLEPAVPDDPAEASSSCTSNLMARYCNVLLKPYIKALVLLVFGLLWGGGIYGATRQSQALDFRELLPTDSFIRTYFAALHEYSSEYSYGLTFLRAKVYFRNVDVSDPEIQKQMNDYINDLVDMPYISSPPEFFWLRDFHMFLEYANQTEYADTVAAMSFNDQLTVFLDTPPFDELYSKDIVRDSQGTVTASRCEIIFDRGSNYNVTVQMNTVREQREVTSRQPINTNTSDDWSFFMFTEHFYAWELHDLMASELLLTLILGLVSVFVISLLFIPHPFWAILLPLMVGAVYCQLLAFLHLVGIYINVVTMIGLIMSIGLLVDYNMHVALTYHETQDAVHRNERVRTVLTTMGASIFVGGVTTMTAALPLGLTGSLVFQTFFYTFLAIPVLGIAHGLILLPVFISLWGPHEVPIADSTIQKLHNSFTCDDRLESQLSTSTGAEEVNTSETVSVHCPQKLLGRVASGEISQCEIVRT